MSKFIHKANRGSVFKNTPEENKTAAYSGTLNVEGVFYFINLFKEEGRNGHYYNVTVAKKNEQFTHEKTTPDEGDIPQ